MNLWKQCESCGLMSRVELLYVTGCGVGLPDGWHEILDCEGQPNTVTKRLATVCGICYGRIQKEILMLIPHREKTDAERKG